MSAQGSHPAVVVDLVRNGPTHVLVVDFHIAWGSWVFPVVDDFPLHLLAHTGARLDSGKLATALRDVVSEPFEVH